MYPSFYDPSKVGTMFKPDLHLATQAGKDFAKANGITASSQDKGKRVFLCLIDMQVDFINPINSEFPGNLSVPGAVDDVRRVCEFIFRNVSSISHIVASLDTHYLYQPFHPFTWIAGSNPAPGYSELDHPKPFTVISLQDIEGDVWRPARMFNRMREMITKLESGSKKQLCIWPLHCELGTPGHALDPMLMMALHWHAAARSDQYELTEKGMSQSSEHYGILKSEVEFADDPTTQLNTNILNRWASADAVYFAGEARSHCCLETLNQVHDQFSQKSPEVLNRLYVLEDCMSNVPDITDGHGNVIVPFGQIATDRFKELATAGFKFVKSTDPVKV